MANTNDLWSNQNGGKAIERLMKLGREKGEHKISLVWVLSLVLLLLLGRVEKFISDPGKKNGLYWENKEGEEK
jgi:DUF2950 family protein